MTLDESYVTLTGLTLRQDEIFRQGLRCVENGLFRAAHVMAWAGMVDCLQTLIASDGFTKLKAVRSKWTLNSVEQMSEFYTEYALIEAMGAMNIFTKAEAKALFGMLSKRNECAHPGDYFPSFNETLGYISEIFSRLRAITTRYPSFQL
ncbi:hypothetical protein [Sphingomonas sp. LM7]|uniref:hypothetical protein n=1 Tax=Sphingomonas sp. LM7 TaxID=1938607 RepID=UPI00123771B0|nr:hypothetical protein [Sphingomonas sp. LM7]